MNRRTKSLVVFTFLILFSLGFEAGGFQWSIIKISEEYCLSYAVTGTLVMMQYGIMIAIPLLIGAPSDRFGKKIFLIAAVGCFTAGCTLTTLAQNIWLVSVGIMLIGAGYSACECMATAVMIDFYPDKSRKYINNSQCLFCLGAVVGPMLLEYGKLHLGTGWRMNFLISGLSCAAVIWPLGKARIEKIVTRTEGKKIENKAQLGINFAVLMLLILLYGSLENGAGYYLDALFTDSLNASYYGAYAISAYWLAMAIGRFVAAKMRMRIEMQIVFCFGMNLCLLITLSFTGSIEFAVILSFLIGLFFAPLWPGLMVAAAKSYPTRTGSVISYLSIASSLGGTVSPMIMGVIAGWWNIRAAFFYLVTVAAIGFACSTIFIFRRKINKQEG